MTVNGPKLVSVDLLRVLCEVLFDAGNLNTQSLKQRVLECGAMPPVDETLSTIVVLNVERLSHRSKFKSIMLNQ